MEKILAKMEKVRMEKILAKMEKIIVSLRSDRPAPSWDKARSDPDRLRRSAPDRSDAPRLASDDRLQELERLQQHTQSLLAQLLNEHRKPSPSRTSAHLAASDGVQNYVHPEAAFSGHVQLPSDDDDDFSSDSSERMRRLSSRPL